MRLEPVDGGDARAVLRALRGAVLGAGPAIALGAASGPRVALPAEMPAGTALVVTTSGSTGYPKSVVLSRSALTSSALATAARLGEGAWLLALPAHYIAGAQVLVRSLIAGREPAMLSGSFSAQAFAAAAHGMASSVGGTRVPTYTSLVPAQVQMLLDAGEHAALASFEAVLVGGQALAPALAERAAAAGARLVRTYGSSETAGGCVYDGVPLDGVRVRVVDGEVQLSGPMLAEGYLAEPERTASVFVDDGGARWYRTGDGGSFDGILRITGRLDNVIVSGGINVSLDRVEQTVRAVAGFESAVVVPVADERWGEASVVVAPRAGVPDADAALAALRDAVGAALGAPARPARLVLVEAVPLLPSGKPDRQALRARVRGEGGA
ncbi:AMP-binding protein [Microbacterium sp. No. 7]|uniref:AMP-binding protein n=1 Tax=Microbacterium sp. No. 7 TaxID=1714373 RepID=UPI0006D0C9AD|nr:AMP-binding protein [Microbacterium sp. No. 7]ALJ21466.1 acyl-CoA synthetase [Microbacterium sp. No. 7]